MLIRKLARLHKAEPGSGYEIRRVVEDHQLIMPKRQHGNATGVWITNLPLSLENVLRALKEAGKRRKSPKKTF